ncbi:amidohydrolase family protein [Verticiella sediminum]|uniref:Amidohydrolase family protein n=1 Tax=Verticiella sediminum TaxID=1247510 RepID=A0A556AWM0_9BURK|nr:amidohydrolase family protein [Verticiella sediminum]TSH96785.1 amidohydrolase family protein [Verticiella sediminum]
MNKVPPFKKLLEGRNEEILEPQIEILDAQHHLFDRPHLRYMLQEYLNDVNAGHRIVGSVYIETQSMARPDGPEELRPVGEVEFANGVAATARSGIYGACRVAASIVGFVDMTTGDRAAITLDACAAVVPQRFKGVRHIAMSHPDESVLRFLTHRPPPDLLKSPGFHAAFKHVSKRGLSFDATVLHHQLPEVGELAAAFPDTMIVLDHAGLATAIPDKAGSQAEAFQEWRANMQALSRHENVFCKISGLGTSYWGFGFIEREAPVGYRELAEAWKPYVETAIELFGANRSMMGSNYPNDGRSCGFVPLWNALKYIVRDYSLSEKAALFRDTAQRVYRVDLQ